MTIPPRHRRDRPIASRGNDENLQDLVRKVTGSRHATAADLIAQRLGRLATEVREQEDATRRSPAATPALTQLDRAIDQLRRLGRTLHDLPEELSVLLRDRLAHTGFQADALPRLEDALKTVRARACTTITGSPDGEVPRGPGRLTERLYGDMVDFVVEQIAQMLADAQGPEVLSGDIKGALHEAVAAFWTYATGQDEPPDLTRKVQREAGLARLAHQARKLDRAAEELLRAGLSNPESRQSSEVLEMREAAFRLRAEAHAIRTAWRKKAAAGTA
jgi:hypothetical protein